ncbi:putative tumor suppressor protein [Caenorhabditis elegans]|nr:putative tumor suppressor protein [Caenorhabditis elegans]CAQ35022.1 Candidate tumor suppressor protein [Caenorhabditis elegans]|eukprot:NP_001122426.1 Uncharacterized protein CELE_C36B1.6 [Caenorhabditis elegans]
MYVGISRIDHCPVNSNIPIWMICIASLMVIQVIMESFPCVKDRSVKKMECSIDCCSIFSVLLNIARMVMFGGTILGCVLVISTFSRNNECDQLLYWTSFIFCAFFIIFYSITTCIFICCCCCIFTGAYRSVPTNEEVQMGAQYTGRNTKE